MSYNMNMENKKRNTKPMGEWDKQVCARLDDLWNRHNSGELKTEAVDAVFANARERVEREIKEQQTRKAESQSAQPINYAL